MRELTSIGNLASFSNGL